MGTAGSGGNRASGLTSLASLPSRRDFHHRVERRGAALRGLPGRGRALVPGSGRSAGPDRSVFPIRGLADQRRERFECEHVSLLAPGCPDPVPRRDSPPCPRSHQAGSVSRQLPTDRTPPLLRRETDLLQCGRARRSFASPAPSRRPFPPPPPLSLLCLGCMCGFPSGLPFTAFFPFLIAVPTSFLLQNRREVGPLAGPSARWLWVGGFRDMALLWTWGWRFSRQTSLGLTEGLSPSLSAAGRCGERAPLPPVPDRSAASAGPRGAGALV